MNDANPQIGTRLNTEVLDPMKRAFVGKDEVIDLLGVCLVGGENLFILGPPGTAKSALVQALGQRLHGPAFTYLLTRFTEPAELFGPFDIRRLREGELRTNTDGMLTGASLVFLDELLNANSAILNSLLTALNERVVHRGQERIVVQALMFVGASNHLPEDDALHALFDRFLLRVHCDNVPAEQLAQVLDAGWRMESAETAAATLSFDEVRAVQRLVGQVALDPVRGEYVALIGRIRQAGICVSDRRAVKLQRLIAASALISGRLAARHSDFWVLRYIWDSDDQQEVLRALVQDAMVKEPPDADGARHPQAGLNDRPDAEALARDLAWIEERLVSAAEGDRALLRDRLAILDGRAQWVQVADQRDLLAKQIKALWPRLAEPAEPAAVS
jgi:MoxR-like ATPase